MDSEEEIPERKRRRTRKENAMVGVGDRLQSQKEEEGLARETDLLPQKEMAGGKEKGRGSRVFWVSGKWQRR